MLFFILYKIGEFIALRLPINASYTLATFISDIKFIFSPAERRQMVESLKLVLPGRDEESLKRCARQIFVNFSKYLVDFFRFKKVDPVYIEEQVEIIGMDFIDSALKKGKGAILLSAHLGNWELGGAIMGVLGYPINVIALDHKNKFVNNFFVSQRRLKNENIISARFAVRKCFEALTGNELIAIVGDKDFLNTGTIVKFFGKDTFLPKGPAVFSLKTGADIIPTFLIRAEGDKFKLIFSGPIEYQPKGDFEKDLNALTQLCAAKIEKCVREFPTQWYCFRRFWLN